MRAIQQQMDPVNMVKILLVGRSGAGKTYAIAGMNGLWYFTHEPDGVPVVKARNPFAKVWILEDNLKDYAEMKALLTAPHAACSGRGCASCRFTGTQAAADGCRAVAYDSLSEAQRICLAHAVEVNKKRRKNPLPEGGADELEYNFSYFYLGRLLSMFRSIQLPMIVLAHCREPEPVVRLPGGGQASYVQWYIPGKGFDSRIPRFFTAIGGLHHRLGPPQERAVVFDPSVVWGGRMFRSKMAAGLRSVEPPEPDLWLANMSAAFRGEAPTGSTPEIDFDRVAAPAEPPAETPADRSESKPKTTDMSKFIPE